ncbi:SIMPL domain-containing protein [Cetobacterium sp. 2A]|uniref:SIMPL domain-containing protein n=1 Tax=unclassified Cetobacterium TaxID=2630983 RepID=UPI00163BD699|nr:SIMPL domain-containing protein [Cetobacterium sp. 2A]MBC2855166.1 SIMPL domain-containing protein [Cetobacterium sp. 2A]
MIENKNLTLAALILAVGISSAGFFVNSGIKYFKSYDRSVAVKGLSEEIVKSDLATWNINFTVSGDNLKDLYDNVSENQSVIKEFLISRGFKNDEIQIGTLMTQDNWNNNYGNTSSNLPRFTITGSITLSTPDVDLVYNSSQNSGELVNKGIIVTYSNINYFYTNLNTIKEKMLNEATQNAKRAAETFAQNTDSKISGIKHASQGVFTITSPDSISGDTVTIDKKVRVVTSIDFFLR